MRELRERCENVPELGGITFIHIADPVGIVPIICNPENAGAVFQAASQFNALEMTGPGVTRASRRSRALPYTPPIQRKAPSVRWRALQAPFPATISSTAAGQGGKTPQVDTLGDVGEVVGNGAGKIWTMQNGYALPATPHGIGELGQRLHTDQSLLAAAEAALRVGVMWDTQVKPPHTHRVCQVYASALPVAYAKSTKSTDWAPFASLVLRATYEATLRVALCLAIEQKRRVRVFLTALGGGAFGNRHQWIVDAITNAIECMKDAPLDVVMVHYGSKPKEDWLTIKAPKSSKAAPSVSACAQGQGPSP